MRKTGSVRVVLLSFTTPLASVINVRNNNILGNMLPFVWHSSRWQQESRPRNSPGQKPHKATTYGYYMWVFVWMNKQYEVCLLVSLREAGSWMLLPSNVSCSTWYWSQSWDHVRKTFKSLLVSDKKEYQSRPRLWRYYCPSNCLRHSVLMMVSGEDGSCRKAGGLRTKIKLWNGGW